MSRDNIARLIRELWSQMEQAAKVLEFEWAALLRARVMELRREPV